MAVSPAALSRTAWSRLIALLSDDCSMVVGLRASSVLARIVTYKGALSLRALTWKHHLSGPHTI